MIYYFRKYPLAIVIIIVIFYLSFFTPPKTELDEVQNIDKLVHICMYGGLCLILWIEYIRTHTYINRTKIFIGAIVAPIIMSGIIEIMQSYCTTNRSGDWMDFAFNCAGIIIAAAIGYYILPGIIKKKR